MAVNISSVPDPVVLAGNPVKFAFDPDDETSGSNVKASQYLTFTNQPTAGQTFTVSVLNGAYELVFTADATPDNSGNQFPSGSGAATNLYILSVKSWIEKNFLIANYYDVSVVVTALVLTAKEYGSEYDLEFLSHDFTGSTSAITSGSTPILNDFFAVHALLYGYINSAWEKINEDRVTPDADGLTIFDFSDVLISKLEAINENVLNCQYPDAPGNDFLTLRNDLRLKFKIAYSELYGAPPVPEYINKESSEYYALPGGLSKAMLAYFNAEASSFYEYLTQEHNFLTWQPETNTYHYEQFVRLYYFNLFTTASIKLIAKAYYSDNTTSTQTVETYSGSSKYDLFEVVASILELYDLFEALIPAGETITKYEVYLTDLAGVRISNKIYLKIDYTDHEATRYFLYKNSFGVYETIYTTGSGLKYTSYEKLSIEKFLGLDYTNLQHESALVDVK